MKTLFYPAIFHKAEEGGFWVSFPDFPECLTQGEKMEDAYQMAVDALGLAITGRVKEKEPLPVPSLPEDVSVADDSFSVIIGFDMEAYRRSVNYKAVKKTLSIPQWLNEEAIEKGINFSQVLQEALITKLNV